MVIFLFVVLVNSVLFNSVVINNRLWVVFIFLGIVFFVGFLLIMVYFNYFVMSGSVCCLNIIVNRV